MRIGTRGSKLALIQTDIVKNLLKSVEPDLKCEINIIRTKGNKITDVPLHRVGKAIFVKEIDNAILDGRIDCAVHSMKDVPSEMEEGLIIAAVPKREEPNEVIVGKKFNELTNKDVVGTSSIRRRAQLLSKIPNIKVKWIRGNVDTRIKKLKKGEFTALIMAYAGVKRMGFQEEVREVLDIHQFMPAPCQGAIAVVASEDSEYLDLLKKIDHKNTRYEITAERSLLRTLGGGCQVPFGVNASLNKKLQLKCLLLDPQGKRKIFHEESGDPKTAKEIGERCAHALVEKGASHLLDIARNTDLDELFDIR
ncbi:MAG: hydroxymethylbilane synthase [Candidatus Hydrothermarchaeota archaeon]